MKKKLLFVMNTMGVAGAETALLTLMNVLGFEEYDMDFLAILPRGEMFCGIPDKVNILNKKYDTRSVFSVGGRIYVAKKTVAALLKGGWIFKNFKYFRSLRKEQKSKGINAPEKLLWRPLSLACPAPDTEYDLAVAYLEGAATYLVGDRVRAKKKAAFIHIDYQTAGYSRNTDLGVYDKFDRIFTVSSYGKQRFLEIYPEYTDKTFEMQNVIDTAKIHRMADEGTGFDDDFDGIRLLTVGRLHYQKGYDIAIEAMKLLRDEGENIRWYILGEGSERAGLEALIKEYKLEKNFVLLGFQSNPYVFMKQCDIYIHATRFEGKSIAIDEAMVLAKPIIASDYISNKEQIDDGVTGLLTTLDARNMADTIKRLASDKAMMKRFSDTLAASTKSYTQGVGKLIEII